MSSRGGLATDRLVLIGIGVWSGSMAVVTVILVMTNPWNLALAAVLPVAIAGHRRLDLMSLDEDTPRLLGLSLGRDRLMSLVGAALLTAAAVSAVGVIGFVGLVAPHAAPALVGSHHRRVLPVAALLGATLVSLPTP